MLAATMLFALVASALPTTSSTSPLATCDSSYDYSVVNATLNSALLEQIGKTSQQAQLAGASTYILGYEGYGNMIASMTGPMVTSLNTIWTPTLDSVIIKCAACAGSDNKTMNESPHKYPIMSHQYLYTLYNLTRNLLEELDQKQCSVPGYTPAANVQIAMRPFLDAVWGNMGVGPTVGKANGMGDLIPSGAILPFYECISQYAKPEAALKYTDVWFAVNEMVMKINGTACVAH